MTYKQIICAIDTDNLTHAKNIIHQIAPNIGLVKLGLEFFTKYGADGVREIQSLGVDIFLDLKFHDIPNTVAKAVMQATKLGVKIMTIHTQGGVEMMQAAKQASIATASELGIAAPMIFGVTILTSMERQNLRDYGVDMPISQMVNNLAQLAVRAGLDGCVCSPLEIAILRNNHPTLKLLTPAIRPKGVDSDDQKRIMTPPEAIDAGADYIVIGRPITNHNNPKQASYDIRKSLEI